jgi:hypothetical protein
MAKIPAMMKILKSFLLPPLTFLERKNASNAMTSPYPPSLIVNAREMAKKMLSEDPKFEMPKNQLLKSQIQKILRSKPNWGRIA